MNISGRPNNRITKKTKKAKRFEAVFCSPKTKLTAELQNFGAAFSFLFLVPNKRVSLFCGAK